MEIAAWWTTGGPVSPTAHFQGVGGLRAGRESGDGGLDPPPLLRHGGEPDVRFLAVPLECGVSVRGVSKGTVVPGPHIPLTLPGHPKYDGYICHEGASTCRLCLGIDSSIGSKC